MAWRPGQVIVDLIYNSASEGKVDLDIERNYCHYGSANYIKGEICP